AKTVSDNTDPDRAAWLLKASTLANDIGDDEDTFQKLPASLPTTRLSAAQFEEGRTYRVSNAVIMTLNFNMADYSQALWDKDDDGQVDTTMELFFRPSRPAQGLTVKTALRDIPITSEHISLLPSDIPADDRGHIVITITNPKGQNVAIDIIALGLARVP
ncbi:MAG: hypothetical protein HY006_00195, partial [Candidatus Sungbacteria bacterium]|nr:hypothetical protein [Candidatus Sungbacteria bacterium]